MQVVVFDDFSEVEAALLGRQETSKDKGAAVESLKEFADVRENGRALLWVAYFYKYVLICDVSIDL